MSLKNADRKRGPSKPVLHAMMGAMQHVVAMP